MFTGFVKSLPLEIEEAAAIDGCGPVGTFFRVVLPMLKPTMISVGVLEIMWVWNDYLLPSLVLDVNQIPHHPHPYPVSASGSYGTVDMGATMALIMLSILPVIIFYLCCQKHIIKGVAAGAVQGHEPGYAQFSKISIEQVMLTMKRSSGILMPVYRPAVPATGSARSAGPHMTLPIFCTQAGQQLLADAAPRADELRRLPVPELLHLRRQPLFHRPRRAGGRRAC